MTATLTINIMLDSEGNYALAVEADDLGAAFEEAHSDAVGPTACYVIELQVPLPTTQIISAVIEGKPGAPVQLRIVR